MKAHESKWIWINSILKWIFLPRLSENEEIPFLMAGGIMSKENEIERIRCKRKKISNHIHSYQKAIFMTFDFVFILFQ